MPKGVTMRDARDILPEAQIFRYPVGTFNEGSLSGFANLFRYTLLERIGGWWVDVDVCCLRAFPTGRAEVYLREKTKTDEFLVASCIFRAPSASAVLQRCLEIFAGKDITKVVHSETGPMLLTAAIRTCGREGAVQSGHHFCPFRGGNTSAFSPTSNSRSMVVSPSIFGIRC